MEVPAAVARLDRVYPDPEALEAHRRLELALRFDLAALALVVLLLPLNLLNEISNGGIVAVGNRLTTP